MDYLWTNLLFSFMKLIFSTGKFINMVRPCLKTTVSTLECQLDRHQT